MLRQIQLIGHKLRGLARQNRPAKDLNGFGTKPAVDLPFQKLGLDFFPQETLQFELPDAVDYWLRAGQQALARSAMSYNKLMATVFSQLRKAPLRSE